MKVLSDAELAGIKLRNRFVRSATYEGMADDAGHVTEELIATLSALAEGEIGLIISGHSFVMPSGRAGAHQQAIDNDACVPGLAELAAAVHEHGSKIVIQLAHAGGMAAVDDPAGPSGFAAARTGRVCRAMTTEEIGQAVKAYAAAAQRAKDAGCDGVQIHSAHGYMLSQFLSPHFNQRTDEYGGTLENRARLLLEIVAAIRAQVGHQCPLLVKINSQDFMDDGLTEEDFLQVAQWLEKAGVDAIEVSGGVLTSENNLGPSRRGRLALEDEGYFRSTAAKLKQLVRIPVILVGGIRTPEAAERLLMDGVADFFSLSRPLIREPGLVRRWREGDTSSATCVSCNLCFRPVMLRQKVYCLAAAKQSGSK